MNILFVCSGNTCRSPLAEAIARNLLASRGAIAQVSSAGTAAWEGAPASDGALLVGMERGLDLSEHRARALTASLLGKHDLVLAMAPQHVERAMELAPRADVHLLGDFATGRTHSPGVSDPYGGGLDVYRSVASEIEELVTGALDRLAAEGALGSP